MFLKKPKLIRRKALTKFREQIENKKLIEKLIETDIWFFER